MLHTETGIFRPTAGDAGEKGKGMDASVVICTRDRAGPLARALASLEATVRPAGFAWELVVVDNGSSDGTAAALKTFAGRLPLLTTWEPIPGVSNARNRGVATARGRYLIWTDDDVVVEPGWLAAYAEAFRHWPQAALFGGRILPVLEEPVCRWFAACQDALADPLARRDFGEAPLPLSVAEDRLPFGANCAVRAAEQRRFPFDPELGRAPGRERMAEETQVLRAILEQGGTGRYLPDAVVRHMIPASRQTAAYVLSYYRAHGETAAMTETPGRGRRLAGLPFWLWRRLAGAAGAYALARACAVPRVWLPRLKTYAYWHGYAGFLRGQGRRGGLGDQSSGSAAAPNVAGGRGPATGSAASSARSGAGMRRAGS
jgi:GT2 family glycosyltransferase